MASWDKLKAYLQNPDIAATAFKNSYSDSLADLDNTAKNESEETAAALNSKLENSKVDPMAMANSLEAAQGLGNVAEMTKTAQATMADNALVKLMRQAETGRFNSATDAALYNKITKKVVPVDRLNPQLEALKKLRGY